MSCCSSRCRTPRGQIHGQAVRRHRALQGRVRSRRVRPRRRRAATTFQGQTAARRDADPSRQPAAGSPAGVSRGGLRAVGAALGRRDVGRAVRAPRRACAIRTSASCSIASPPITRRELREWPAAQQIHHAYRGGLLEHTLKMAEVGRALARAYDANEDLVLAGVLLHDIGKLQELQLRARRRHLHARRQPDRPHRPRPDPGPRDDQRHLGLPRRSARADRAPGRVASRHARTRLTGRAENHRGVHPRRRSTSSTRASTRSAARFATIRRRRASSPPGIKRLGRVFYKGGQGR